VVARDVFRASRHIDFHQVKTPLNTPLEAESALARLFAASQTCTVSVREDKAFKEDAWFSLGTMALFRKPTIQPDAIADVRKGGYEWQLPSEKEAADQLTTILIGSGTSKSPKFGRALDAIAGVATRTGLSHPNFDPHALEGMPFRRPMTVVSDTTGVVQGGLDFVARYLHPMARVKIPAIVHMEIVNFAVRFLANRRATRIKPTDLLLDHLMSQGGQRVLLRLELQADIEIERTFLLGDPLRSAFQTDSEPDLRELNLSTTIPAYADRLILEAARHHQAQANIGHPVQLLTSDQGLARMALAEGLKPLFFRSVRAGDFFGRHLTGTIFHPFTGRLQKIPVAAVLWELATAFGTAKLSAEDGRAAVIVSAIGETLSWSPYHSHADLLWLDGASVPGWDEALSAQPSDGQISLTDDAPAPPTGPTSVQALATDTGRSEAVSKPKVGKKSLYRVNINRLFALFDALDDQQKLTEAALLETIRASARSGLDEYRLFLASGNAITVQEDSWLAAPIVTEIAVALREQNIVELKRLMLRFPSFAAFAEELEQQLVGAPWGAQNFDRAARSYLTLGEVLQMGAPIFQEGFYPTPSAPNVSEFASIALGRFRDLSRGEELVATGLWLEALVRHDGIHPERSRHLLTEANASSLLRRSTEGSTTDVRFDKHVIQTLRLQGGVPVVVSHHIYRGDYLIPGKSSSSLRIDEPKL
jgi:hypothetical protein